MAKPCLTGDVTAWIDRLSNLLDGRLAWRLVPLMAGVLFGTGRQTVSSWLRAGELSDDYQDYYYFLFTLGDKTKALAAVVWRIAVEVIAPSGRIVLAIDDTPSKRYGPKVEGAGLHHNPTPGPAGAKLVYGHNWVTLAWVVRHPLWGAIGLPLLARLYVRKKDIDAQQLTVLRDVTFQTKLVMAGAMVTDAAKWVKSLDRTLWVVTDGAYAKRPFLQEAAKAKAIVVSRLRKDAALFDVPPPLKPGERPPPGRPRIYGKNRISLAKRAGQPRGWQTDTFRLYGVEVIKRYKTFLATYPPAGGLIRVVLVKEDDGKWVAYFCTHTEATVTEILEAVADRSAIEQVFHDIKEVHGVGQAQTRNYWTNVAVYHVHLWWHTLIELWAWHRPAKELVDRSASPWDDAERRPSHADKRNTLRRQCLDAEFWARAATATLPRKIQDLWRRLVKLVA
jgi:DDE superfamily endonuclease